MARDDRKDQEGRQFALPPRIREFFDQVVQNDLMRYDILYFFYQNPYAVLTVSDLSIWVSREERPLAEALQELAARKVLTQSYASAAFTMTRDRTKRGQVEEFFDYLREHPGEARQIRASLLRHVEED